MPGAHLILDRLRHLAARDHRPAQLIATLTGASALFTFVTHERERIAGCAFSRMSIVAIVEGAKELVTMGRHLRFKAGTVLVLPAGWRGDVVNDPDPETGAYRAIFIDFPDALVRRAASGFPPTRGPARLDVGLDAALAAAIHHAGEGIAQGNLPPGLVDHRALEVLMVLGLRGALPSRPQTVAETVRALVRWQPDRPWTADLIAAELATSNATLRRRLSEEGTALRDILSGERVALAKAMLDTDGLSLREASLAAGYRSPRRFAERMQAASIEVDPGSG